MSNQPDYKVVKENLNVAAFEKARMIYPPGNPIAQVTINTLPAGAVGKVYLRFGQQGDPIPLRQEAYTWSRTPARDDGLYLDIEPGLGALELIAVVGLDVTGHD